MWPIGPLPFSAQMHVPRGNVVHGVTLYGSIATPVLSVSDPLAPPTLAPPTLAPPTLAPATLAPLTCDVDPEVDEYIEVDAQGHSSRIKMYVCLCFHIAL